jgi:hypothetical protein
VGEMSCWGNSRLGTRGRPKAAAVTLHSQVTATSHATSWNAIWMDGINYIALLLIFVTFPAQKLLSVMPGLARTQRVESMDLSCQQDYPYADKDDCKPAAAVDVFAQEDLCCCCVSNEC